MGQCVQRECVVWGGGFYRYFREQGLLVGVQECLDGFHQRCVDYLSRQFVPKWDSPNTESVLAAADTTSLLMELIGMAA